MPAKIFNFGNESDLGSATLLAEVVKTTTEELTYYVSTTGNDASDGLTPLTALATIQAAIDKVPKFVNHNVTINIGAGTFTYALINQFIIDSKSVFLIKGTLGLATITTGTTSGTSTGGGTFQIIDIGQNWTVNELRGKLLYVGGIYYVIRSNTANTINTVYSLFAPGLAYTIHEQKTILNGYIVTALSGDSYAPIGAALYITVNNCRARSLVVQDLLINAPTNIDYFGVYCGYGKGSSLQRIAVIGIGAATRYGFLYQAQQEWEMYDCYVTNCKGVAGGGFVIFHAQTHRDLNGNYAYNNATGFIVDDSPDVNFQCAAADNNTYSGLSVTSSHFVDMDGGLFDSNGYGIVVDDVPVGAYEFGNIDGTSVLSAGGTFIISNSTNVGVVVGNNAIAKFDNLTGTGNGTYGISMIRGAKVVISSATTITGISGNATIDDGATILTWATDFVNNGDRVSNVLNGCLIERKD